MSKQLNIGLFGFGVVGAAFYKVLRQTPGLNANIKKIVIRDGGKQRSAPASLFTTAADTVLQDDDINVVVELTDDADAAYQIISAALRSGKDVISANKKCIAENLEALLDLQRSTGRALLYEAAACASIPVIRNLEEYYDNDLLQSLTGIVNGSTNYILSRMAGDGWGFKEALLQAQQLGFAESDPSLDIEGRDAVNKLGILLLHAYGLIVGAGGLLYHGITNVQEEDIAFAREKNCSIKLVATAQKHSNGTVSAFVLPRFVQAEELLHNVNAEYNGVVIKTSLADEQFFYGKGAGGFPTASAVLSDLSALRYNYRYAYRKQEVQGAVLTTDNFLRVYVSFSRAEQLVKEDFEWIEEWHSGQSRDYVVAVIHQAKLLESDWWRQPGVSLVLAADAFVNDVALRKVRRRSLELAGCLL